MNREGRADDYSSREDRGPHPRTPHGPRQGLPRPTECRHPGRPRGVVVLNQFALPPSERGGTRHVNLFGRLDAWEPLIVAANRNHATQRPFRTEDPRFHLVWAPEQRGARSACIDDDFFPAYRRPAPSRSPDPEPIEVQPSLMDSVNSNAEGPPGA